MPATEIRAYQACSASSWKPPFWNDLIERVDPGWRVALPVRRRKALDAS